MENQIEPYVRRVYFYETDKMGIVHHSNFVRWFEEARLDFMNKSGLNYREIEELGIIIPVYNYSCSHKKTVLYDDNIEVTVKPKKYNGIRMTFEYEIRLVNDTAIRAVGETTHFFATENMELINLKKKFPEISEKIKNLLKEN